MFDILYNVIAFILAVGVLVTIHEFGHFWVARKLGVKVLRFSVGFGKPLWSKKVGIDQTEYVLAAIPLGGYVKMLDEREAEVDEAELPRAFNRQSVWARIAIVAAGPIFNFLLAIAAYWLVFILGTTGMKPIVGEVEKHSPAAVAGIASESTILDINGQAVKTWQQTRLALLDAGIDGGNIQVTVMNRDLQVTQHDMLVDENLLSDTQDLIKKLGLSPWRPALPPVISGLSAGGAAERDGLLAQDMILSVDGKPVKSVEAWIALIQASPKQRLRVGLERDNRYQEIDLTPKAQLADNGDTQGVIGALMTVRISEEMKAKLEAVVQHSPIDAFTASVEKTYDMSLLTLRVLGKLVVGQADLKNISGPITIAQYAGETARLGLGTFLGFLALISISLGVLNLLPIPILDGGHLFYYLIEIIKGSPLSAEAEMFGQKIGLAILMLLMSVAFYNDIIRLAS